MHFLIEHEDNKKMWINSCYRRRELQSCAGKANDYGYTFPYG